MNQEDFDERRRFGHQPWIHEPETESSGDWFAVVILAAMILMFGFLIVGTTMILN